MFRSIESILRAYRSHAHLTEPETLPDPEERLAVPVASLVVGYETAAAIAKHYSTQDPWELADAFGLRVRCEVSLPTHAPTTASAPPTSTTRPPPSCIARRWRNSRT